MHIKAVPAQTKAVLVYAKVVPVYFYTLSACVIAYAKLIISKKFFKFSAKFFGISSKFRFFSSELSDAVWKRPRGRTFRFRALGPETCADKHGAGPLAQMERENDTRGRRVAMARRDIFLSHMPEVFRQNCNNIVTLFPCPCGRMCVLLQCQTKVFA